MAGKIKPVYFSLKEQELYDYANSLNNFSDWVKNKIRNEIQNGNNGLNKEIEIIVSKILEDKLSIYRPKEQQNIIEISQKVLDDIEKFF